MSQSALQVNLDALATAGRAEVRDGRGAWIRLHSARDPRAEARGQAAELIRRAESCETIVLIGGGLGYLAEALLEDHAHRVIVIEPSADLARACLSRRDWSAWRDTGRFKLRVWPDIDEPAPLWQLFDRDEPEPLVVVQPVVARVAVDLVARIRAHVRRVVFDGRANAEARRRQAGPYLTNTLRNLASIARSADAGALKGTLDGVPVILAAAGPSLDMALPALAAASDRAVIIAVDTALRPLLNAGIAPQLAVALDPTELNARHLMDLPARDQTWLVAEPSLDPRAIAPFGNRLFTFRVADHHPWPWLAEHGITRQLLRVWGSVLTAALDLAILSGADPIVFVGADLAYTEGRPYCRGTAWENGWADLTGRGGSLESQWRADLAARTTEIATDVHGCATTTTPHLVAFRDWLVSRMAEETGRRFVNACGAGLLAGESIVQARLEDVALPARGTASLVRGRIRALSAAAANDAGSPNGRLHAGLQDVLTDAPGSPRATWLEFGKATISPKVLDATIAAASGALITTSVEPAGFDEPVGLLPAADRAALLHRALNAPDASRPFVLSLSKDERDLLLSELSGLCDAVANLAAAVRGDLANDAGRVPVSLLFDLPSGISHRLHAFEDRLARALPENLARAANETSGVRLYGVQSLSPAAKLPLLLVHEWLSVVGPDASRVALDALLATPASSRSSRLVELRIGGKATATPRPDSVHAPRRFLDFELLRVPVERLSPERLSPSGLATTLDAVGALVTPFQGLSSVRISEDGTSQMLPEWPRPIWGEIPWGANGGGFAWHNTDRLLMFRERADAQPAIHLVPFRPLRGVVLADRTSLWCGFDGGVWRWEPGRASEKLADTPSPLHLHVTPDGFRIDFATRAADGVALRQRLSHSAFWRLAADSLEQVALDVDGQCTSIEQHGPWTARAHPYADAIVVAGPNGLTARLAVDYPLTTAWAGRSLVVCTGQHEVYLFPLLADRLLEVVR